MESRKDIDFCGFFVPIPRSRPGSHQGPCSRRHHSPADPKVSPSMSVELQPDSLLDCAIQAAHQAGEYLVAQMGKVEVREKNPRDLVTEADHESQRRIETVIRDRFPGHGFLGEETESLADWRKDYCWVVDPIDGTMNFVHQMPGFSVSIGLFHHGRPLVGVVHDPILKETFSAVRGGGATRNGIPAQVSRCHELQRSLLVCSFPSTVTANSAELIRFNRVVQHATIRRYGSAALNLCYVGCGRLDGYWASTLSLWDLAAGMLFALEGGACVTHLDGGRLDYADPRFLAASTPALHAELLPILQID